MKFRVKDILRVREVPNIDGKIIGKFNLGDILEGEEHSWKKVLLANGKTGYCASDYLEKISDDAQNITNSKNWHPPIRTDKFKLTQNFLNPDPLYKITGHHPGVDYGTQGDADIPLYFCADGEVIENGNNKSFGNYFFYYVQEVDRTFAYFHLRDKFPDMGFYKSGQQCGITGKTGLSFGIHLHLECLKGRKTSLDRSKLYTSKDNILANAEDADAFIRLHLVS